MYLVFLVRVSQQGFLYEACFLGIFPYTWCVGHMWYIVEYWRSYEVYDSFTPDTRPVIRHLL